MATAPASPELARRAKREGRMCELVAVEDWRAAAVQAEGRHPVLASGCGAVSTFRAEPSCWSAGQ